MDSPRPFGSGQERDCSSPLGLFDKFRLDSPVYISDDSSDPEVQFVSEWKSAPTSHLPRNLAGASLNVSNSDKMLGKGNNTVKSERVKRLHVDDNDSVIRGQLDGDLSCPNASDQLTKKDARNLQESAKSLGSKKHPCRKRIQKQKTYDRVKTSKSGLLRKTYSKSVRPIRTIAVQTLSNILLNRIQETENLHAEEEEVRNLAKEVEKEMFSLYLDIGVQYKMKYRSLVFNLKDPRNKIFFYRVVVGEISPQSLVQMSTTEMAGQELLDWRNQERRHTLEIIERAEKDVQHNQQKMKFTKKGLIEIETTPDEIFSLEYLTEKPVKDQTLQNSIVPEKIDTTDQHKSHLLDVNCGICMEKYRPSDQGDDNRWTPWSYDDKAFGNIVEEIISQTDIQETENKDHLDENTEELIQAVWKGSIHMFSVRIFKVTAYQVSGYSTHLCENLPAIITCKGLISPESVWAFVDLIWPACTKKLCSTKEYIEGLLPENCGHINKPGMPRKLKDMCFLRLCPLSARDAISYKRLFFYLNGKLRYGIIRAHKMEAFLVPLPASQPIPAKLRPLGGPGLEDGHPNLLLVLLLPNHPSWTSCPKKNIQKPKEELDIPDDIFTSILEDVEREERQMGAQGLPPVGLSDSEQAPEINNVGMQELMDIITFLTSNLQQVAEKAQNTNYNYNFPGQQNTMPEISQYWQSYNMATGIQASNSSNPVNP